MAASVYAINKGINRPIEFKGLKAQYIWYLGGGLVLLMILFALLYICGVHPFACVLLTLILGTALFLTVYKLSRTYGAYGLMKKAGSRRVPRVLKVNSRRMFLHKFTRKEHRLNYN